MYTEILHNPSFLRALPQIDREIRDNTQKKECPSCGGKLDVSNYKRKIRGIAPEYVGDLELRLSLCCRNEGCRKRVQPASVIFFGRRCWPACFFIVASVLAGGSPKASKDFLKKTQLAPRQLRRWRKWWNEEFVRSPQFREVQGYFPAPTPDGGTVKLPDWICDQLDFSSEQIECNFIKFLKLIDGSSI